MSPPWSVRFEDRAPLGLIAMLRGGAWVIPDPRPGHATRSGRRRDHEGSAGVHRRRRPANPRSGGDPCRAAGHHARRRRPRAGDEPRRAHLGQRPSRLRDLGDRLLSDARRGYQRLLDAMPVLAVLTPDTWEVPARPAARRRGRARRAGTTGRARPAVRPAAHRGRPRLVRAAGGRRAGVVPRPQRPRHRPRRADAPRRSCPSVDRRRARDRRRPDPSPVRPPLHRPGRRATDDLPHQLAAGTGRRPPPRSQHHRRSGRQTGRLQQRLRPQHRIQTRPRHQPHRVSKKDLREAQGRRRRAGLPALSAGGPALATLAGALRP